MILSGVRFSGVKINPSAAAYDADYQAVLDYATGQGWTLPSLTNQAHQNAYVLELKSIGAWTLLDILYIFWSDIDGTGGGDSDFACINFKSPGNFTCMKVNSPTYDDGAGFTGNGTNSYLDTQWDAATNGVNFTLNDASAFAYEGANIAFGARQLFGAGDGSGVVDNSIRINPKNTSTEFNANINDDGNIIVVIGGQSSAGFLMVQRTASNAQKLFKNGTERASSSQVSTSLTGRDIALLAFRANSVVQFRASIIGTFGAGASLSGIESSIYTAWTNYITP